MLNKFIRNILLVCVILLTLIIFDNYQVQADNAQTQSNNSQIKVDYNDNYGIYHWNRFDMESALHNKEQKKVLMPSFTNNQSRPIKKAKSPNGDQLSVWDSWQLKNPDGTLANVNGYHVVFAMQGDPNDAKSMNGRLGMYYQKIEDSKKGIDSWKYGGPLFTSNQNGNNTNNDIVNNETNQWSGSAIMTKQNQVRLFYTSYNADNNGKQQALSTAKLQIKKTSTGITINTNKTTDRKPVFVEDGKYYESDSQAIKQNEDIAANKVNDHTLRDPQIIFDHGNKYLIFESNTGPNVGGSGYQTLNNAANYGGSKQFQKEQVDLMNKNPNIDIFGGSNPINTVTAYSNACIGIIELNDNYTVKKVMKPLIVFNGTHDESERPSVMRYNNRWYLFTSIHGWHMASTENEPGASYMLGFSSDDLTKNYQPLNKNGLVLYNPTAQNTPFLYSYNVLPPQTKNNIPMLTGYITPGPQNNNPMYKTFGPSLGLSLTKNSSYLDSHVYKQGQLTNSTK